MERKVINRKHFSFWSLKNWTFSVLSPKACPYVMMRPPIVAVINHRICEGKRNLGIFLFAFLDNLISEDWFFAVKRRAVFILLAMPPPSQGRAALVLWCG